MFIQEHNCETGEITLRELTAKEISQREKEHSEYLAEATAKAATRAALLTRLGITEEEARILLGGN
jgi:hypothetical protein